MRKAFSFHTVLAVFLLFSLLFTAAAADTEKDGFHFDENGFLTGDDNPADEYLQEDDENGIWQYASKLIRPSWPYRTICSGCGSALPAGTKPNINTTA